MKAEGEPVLYSPLLPHPNQQHYAVLPLYHAPNNHHSNRRGLRRCLIGTGSFLLVVTAIFLLWPSQPDLKLVRIHLNHVRVHTSPQVSLDLSLSLTVKVSNRDFFSLDYSSLAVTIGYRGRELGFVTSSGGHLRARGSSYVNATLEVDGLEVLHDVFYLLQDLAKGSIPFDTDTVVQGKLGLFFFIVPLKARVSCEIYVNTNNQKIIRQDCYPE